MPVKKIVKKVAKKPAVTVQTKKISDSECCAPKMCTKGVMIFKVFIVGVILLNTVLLVCLMGQQNKIEAMRVGGAENYKMLNEVFRSEAFKDQQKQQIQQAMQMYNIAGPEAMAPEVLEMPVE